MKSFKVKLLNLNIKCYIYLLIIFKLVISDSETESNCADCIVDDNFKCYCTGDNCKCIDDCRPNSYNTGRCYDCTNAFNKPYNTLYSIENGRCVSKSISDCKKITIDNNECVDDCDSQYEFGDYCYSDCTKYQMEFDTNPLNQCKCMDTKPYIIEELIENKIKYLRCTSTCPYGYHDLITNYCVQNCNGKKITPDKACTDSCIDYNNHFLYTKKEVIDGYTQEIKYCVSSCPESKRYYYNTGSTQNEKECIEECRENDYYSYTSDECLLECNKMIIVDDNKHYCTDKDIPTSVTDYKCGETDFPYQYINYCLKDCSDTIKLDGKTTYLLKMKVPADGAKTIFLCSKDCTEDTKSVYKDLSTLSCVEDCSKTPNKFNYNNECINSCDKLEHFPNHKIDSKECVSSCGNNYYLLKEEKTCYKECPQNSEYKYIDSNNHCTTCKIPEYGEIGDGIGYIYKNDDKFYCLESCEIDDDGSTSTPKVHYYHNDKDNKCITPVGDKVCGENNEYKYYKGEDPDYICYKSCKDIPDEYIHQYNNKCFKAKSSIEVERTTENIEGDIYFVYYLELGLYIYMEGSNHINFCAEIGYFYYKKGSNNNECVKDCGDDFQVLYELDNLGAIRTLGKCYETCSETNNNYPFYTIDEKICYSECPYKSVFKSNGEVNGVIQFELLPNGQNCVKACPRDYSYESKDGKKCYDVCPKKFYVENDNKKVCEDNCGNDKYYFDGEFKCLDRCQKTTNGKTNYYFYIEKMCVDTCNIVTDDPEAKTFSFEATNNHQPCLKECPDGYKYYETEKICLKNCKPGDFFYEEEGENKKCLRSCGNGKYIINGNICSTNCTNEEPFYYSVFVGSDEMYKCTSNCINGKLEIFQRDSNGFYQCLPSCSKVLYNNECRDSCPQGLYEENQRCKMKCDNNDYYINDNGVYKCKNKCGNTDSITSNNECVKYCPFGQNFIGNGNKCKNYCSSEDGEYYYRINIDQSDSTDPTDITDLTDITDITKINYEIYKCVKKCSDIASYTYYSLDDSKECVTSCPADYFKSENEKMCYSLCLKSDKYIFSIPDSNDPPSNECSESCPSTAPNYGEDKICVNGCSSFENNKIINKKDNSCVSKCEISSTFKFLYEDDNNNALKYCLQSCNDGGNKKKYLMNDFRCVEKCPKPYNYLINNEICSDKCETTQIANEIPSGDGEENDDIEYECKSSCDSNLYYYRQENLCLKSCKVGDYNIENTYICIKNCSELNTNEKKYYFYDYEEPAEENISPSFQRNTCVTNCPEEKSFKDINDHCYSECQANGYKYYIPTEKKCLKECPKDKDYKKNGYECVMNCPTGKFLNETGYCVNSCDSSLLGYKYYYQSNKICIKECNETDFINGNECVTSCPKYIFNQKCVDECPPEKKFFIDVFEHGETNLNNFCSIDCPIEYPFFKIEKEGEKELYKCIGSCQDYYISSKDTSIIAKECVESCKGAYKHYFQYNNTHKECFEVCPNGKKYYVKSQKHLIII